MAYTASKLLEIARAELGYKEKETKSQLDNPTANAGDNNWTKYARDLYDAGYYQSSKNGYAWCDVFVDWCFWKLAGSKEKGEWLECQTGLYGAGCGWSSNCYRKANRFDKNPQPGDQIFFGKTGGETHTGIVEKVENGKVYTIEGNSSDMVQRCTYSMTSSKIVGYGHPRFDTESNADDGSNGTTTNPTDLKFKVGDIVNFNGTNHYVSANSTTGPKVKPGKAKVTAISKNGKHPYHCRAVNDAGTFISGVYGWVDASDLTEIFTNGSGVNNSWTPKVGDIVNYTGNKHYSNANALTGPTCKGGLAKITNIYQVGKSKHPYHLVRVSGKGASVYGWVDEGSFTKV